MGGKGSGRVPGRPRRTSILRGQQESLEDTQKASVQKILETLNPYMEEAATLVGEAARAGDKKSAMQIMKFVADNAPGASDNRALQLINAINKLRKRQGREERYVPPDVDVEQELAEGGFAIAGRNKRAPLG